MDQARWDLINQIFERALRTDAENRGPFIEQQCQGDPSIQREVEALIAEATAGDPAELLPSELTRIDGLRRDDTLIGASLGGFTLERALGYGGSGSVYLGVRSSPFRQQAAIKILRVDHLDDEVAIQRFRRERQLLASLQHAGVAKLLGGGRAADGRPYFIAEYVNGEPITTYCREHDLPLRDRLKLLRQVFAAVNYAHHNGVIHRDLKPSNILVRDDGVVKIVDFGTAKLLRACSRLDGVFPETLTVDGWLPMTPAYASPEQVMGGQITTLSDIFSLGVVVFEVVAGERPFAFETGTLVEIANVLSEGPPPLRSKVAIGQTASSAEERKLQLNVAHVVSKALRPEPQERYQSVGEFDRDIQACLKQGLVHARSDALWYRVRSSWRKQRQRIIAGSMLIALAVVALLGWLQSSSLEYVVEPAIVEASKAFHEYELGETRRASKRLGGYREEVEGGERAEWSLLAGLLESPVPTILNTESPITEAEIYPGENWIVTTSLQGALEIWDLDSDKRLRRFESANQPLHALSISSDGKTIAAAGSTLALWDVESGKRMRELKEYPANVESLQFANDDKELVVGYRYEALELLRVADGAVLSHVPCHSGFLTIEQYPGKQQFVCSMSDPPIKSGERVLQLRNADLNEVLREYRHTTLEVMAMSCDEKWLAASSEHIGEIVLFDAMTSEKHQVFSGPGGGLCRSLAFGLDDSFLASGHVDGTVRVWPIRKPTSSGKSTLRLDETRVRVLDAGDGGVKVLLVAADGRLVASAADESRIMLWKLPAPVPAVYDLPITPAFASKATGVDRFIMHDSDLTVWVSASSSFDKWQDVSKLPLGDERQVSWGISPDGNLITTNHGRNLSGLIDISQPSQPVFRGELPDSDALLMMKFSPDGKYVASICEAEERRSRVVVWEVASRQKLYETAYPFHEMDLAFSPDSTILAVAGLEPPHDLVLLDAASGRELNRLPSGESTAHLEWSPDGRVLADIQRGGRVYLVPVGSPTTSIDNVPVVGATSYAKCAFSPDSRTLVTGCGDGLIQLWDVRSGMFIALLYDSPAKVAHVSFSADGKHLFAIEEGPPSLLRWDLVITQ